MVQHVLAEDDVGPGDLGVQAVVHHGLGSGRRLLGGLEEGDERPVPCLPLRGYQLRRAEQAGDVDVVPNACMTGTCAPSASTAVSVEA